MTRRGRPDGQHVGGPDHNRAQVRPLRYTDAMYLCDILGGYRPPRANRLASRCERSPVPQRSDVLDLAILGRLSDGPLHGYELRKRIMAGIGVFRTLSFGSLYPRLRALAERGLVTATDSALLPHALAGRRSRIVYELTAPGKEFLAQTLSAPDPTAWDDDVFDLRFSMFADTDPSTRLRILEGRRTRVLEQREASRQAHAKNRERRDSYTLELQRHGLELLDSELGWLDGLIATERDRAERQQPGKPGRANPGSTTPPGSDLIDAATQPTDPPAPRA